MGIVFTRSEQLIHDAAAAAGVGACICCSAADLTSDDEREEAMKRKSPEGAEYPENWDAIAKAVKDAAGWRCVRCNHEHEPKAGYTLTVHHLDIDPSNCAWWNIPALCQRCHLQIQNKVVMEQPFFFPHSEWFKPYVAAYYAVVEGLLPMTRDYYDSLVLARREFVEQWTEYFLKLGQHFTPIPGTDHFEEAW